MDVAALQTQASARGSASGFVDTFLDTAALPGIERRNAKIFTPLRVGSLSLQHRVVHPAMGRSRSVHGAESPLAARYFAQRTTPGSLIISQATGISAESVAWPWAASLHNSIQQSALSEVIQAVHEKGGYWFQQLFHVGRCTTPALVKRARDQAGFYGPPSYGYRPVSSSNVAESGFNTHSGENGGIPHALTVEEIHSLKEDFKNAAQRAVDAGADGIEVLAGNGWLIDQFLHDNINTRTDEYGGNIENRSRLALEVVEAVAEVAGYQRIGIRLSPFSYFHETDGSQPLDQILNLCHELVRRGIAYLHVGQGKFTRGLSLEQNVRRLVAKGIPLEDISLRPFRRLLSSVHPADPLHTRTVLIGNGGYNGMSAILSVEEGLADGVSFGRRFISTPDLVKRLQLGYSLTPNNTDTFYSHGAEGYISYAPYSSEQENSEQNSVASENLSEDTQSSSVSEQGRRRVAIIGAGVSGIVSAAALNRIEGFDVHIFERRGVPGGLWVYDAAAESKPQFPAEDPTIIEQSLPRSAAPFPVTVTPRSQHRFEATPLYPTLREDLPYNVMMQGSTFEISSVQDPNNPYLTGEEISEAVAQKAHQFDHLIEYHTTVENVEKLDNDSLRLTLRKENPDGTDTADVQEFDHLIVASGHHSVPRLPNIPGLENWAGKLSHSVTWRSAEEFKAQKILIVGTGESAIDIARRSLQYAKTPVYMSQRTSHPELPTVFAWPGVELVPTVLQITSDTIYLSDGRSLIDIDTIVFATGYLYSYPFLTGIRPPPVTGCRVPALYQHIFDIHNPGTIAFNGVVNGFIPWVTWEKSAFLIGLLWSGKIHLPSREDQEAWEARRLAELGDRNFHTLAKTTDQVLLFDDLNELAAEYLFTDSRDDLLLRSFPFRWVLEILNSRKLQAGWYSKPGLTETVEIAQAA